MEGLKSSQLIISFASKLMIEKVNFRFTAGFKQGWMKKETPPLWISKKLQILVEVEHLAMVQVINIELTTAEVDKMKVILQANANSRQIPMQRGKDSVAIDAWWRAFLFRINNDNIRTLRIIN